MAAVMYDWIAVDWGTTNLRAWAIRGGRAEAHLTSAEGMGCLARDQFEPALVRLISPWLGAGRTTVIACGMVGSRQGWHEAPYRTVPCTPLDTEALVEVPTHDPRLRVLLVPGLRQLQPADVMRGEETQIAGALALYPGFEGVLCLPGTHSKWVQVSAGEVIGFQTYLTGEMFDLLSRSSVLRHGMIPGPEGRDWDPAGFDAGVAEALARPEKLSARLFAIRAEGLVHGLEPASARARLSGLLIGAELAAARGYWLGQNVALVGPDTLCGLYARALSAQAVPARSLGATECTLAGLASLYREAVAAR